MHYFSFATTILPQFFHPATLLLSPTFPKTSPFPSLSAKYDRGPTPSADCGVAWAAREMGTGRLAVCLSSFAASSFSSKCRYSSPGGAAVECYVPPLGRCVHLNATFRRFAVSLTSSPCPVLVAWRPHSGLWRPAGLWRISCPPGLATLGSRPPFCPLGAHDILRTTQRAMANDEAPMANASLRVN